jgi:hypothetical protein
MHQGRDDRAWVVQRSDSNWTVTQETSTDASDASANSPVLPNKRNSICSGSDASADVPQMIPKEQADPVAVDVPALTLPIASKRNGSLKPLAAVDVPSLCVLRSYSGFSEATEDFSVLHCTRADFHQEQEDENPRWPNMEEFCKFLDSPLARDEDSDDRAGTLPQPTIADDSWQDSDLSAAAPVFLPSGSSRQTSIAATMSYLSNDHGSPESDLKATATAFHPRSTYARSDSQTHMDQTAQTQPHMAKASSQDMVSQRPQRHPLPGQDMPARVMPAYPMHHTVYHRHPYHAAGYPMLPRMPPPFLAHAHAAHMAYARAHAAQQWHGWSQ